MPFFLDFQAGALALLLSAAAPAKVGGQLGGTSPRPDGGAAQEAALPPRGVRYLHWARGTCTPPPQFRFSGRTTQLAGRYPRHSC